MSEGLAARDLVVRFGAVTAVDGASVHIGPGETLGLVGESGCGKSTLARAMVRLVRPDSGVVSLDGSEVSARDSRRLRRQVQMVFQDPAASLNPRMTVRQLIDEPLAIHRRADVKDRRREVDRLLELVHLRAEHAGRYPSALSGGQRQRVAIARALAVQPRYLILDEVTSALDVSVQSTVLDLLVELQRELRIGYLFISHNLAVVKAVSHRVAVMYLGRVVEQAGAEELFREPKHPYTRLLLDSAPALAVPGGSAEPRAAVSADDDVPDPADPPAGCRFHPRCGLRPLVDDAGRCVRVDPQALLATRGAACHYARAGGLVTA